MPEAGLGHVELAGDDANRRCPSDGRALWIRRVSKKGIVFHSLRHTMATLLARAKMRPTAAQKILRHANLETTLAIYRHVDGIEELRAAVAKLDFGPLEEQAPFKTISKVPSTDDSEWIPPPARTTGSRCRSLRDVW